MRSSKFIILITCAWGISACGSLPEPINESYAIDGFDSITPPSCTSCPVIEEPAPRPIPTIAAYPEDLMFYGDSSAVENLAPQRVVVKNDTSSTVLLSNVYIVDDGQSSTGEGGAAYFTVSTTADLDKPLYAGDSVEFEVAFALSSTQRSAFLVFETTHTSYSSLVVTLYGKYFDW